MHGTWPAGQRAQPPLQGLPDTVMPEGEAAATHIKYKTYTKLVRPVLVWSFQVGRLAVRVVLARAASVARAVMPPLAAGMHDATHSAMRRAPPRQPGFTSFACVVQS